MSGKIVIDSERCKGCGLCIEVCTRQAIRLAKSTNRMGYFFAEPCETGCTGCALCALICPDTAIEVFRNSTVAPDERHPGPSKLIKERS